MWRKRESTYRERPGVVVLDVDEGSGKGFNGGSKSANSIKVEGPTGSAAKIQGKQEGQ